MYCQVQRLQRRFRRLHRLQSRQKLMTLFHFRLLLMSLRLMLHRRRRQSRRFLY